MQGSGPVRHKLQIAHVAALMLLVAVVFFFRLGDRTLWSSMEGRVAEIAAEMTDTGDYIMPRINGRVELTKPPLAHWLVAGSFRVFGRSAFTARLPSALAALATVLAVYFFGRRLAGHWCGIFSAGTLATALDFVWMGRCARIDNVFSLLVVLAILLFYLGYTGRGRAGLWVAAFACMGLAVMAKGPAGIGIPLGAIVLFLAVRRDLAALVSWPTLAGLCVCTVLAAPWHVFVLRVASEDDRRFFLVGQLGEWLEGERQQSWVWLRTIWKYIPYLLKGLFPWSIFLPVGIAVAAKQHARTLRSGILLPLVWLVGGLVAFSLSGTKAARYLLPMYPAAALIVGFAWARLLQAPTPGLTRGITVSTIITSVVLGVVIAVAGAAAAAAPTVLRFLKQHLNEHDYRSYDIILRFLGRHWLPVLAIVIAAAAAVATAAFAVRCGKVLTAFVLVSCVLAAMLLAYTAVVLPQLDEVNSARPFALYVRNNVPPEARLVYSGDWLHEFRFYLGRHVEFIATRPERLANVRAALADDGPLYVVVLDEDYDELASALLQRAELLHSTTIDYHRAYLLKKR